MDHGIWQYGAMMTSALSRAKSQIENVRFPEVPDIQGCSVSRSSRKGKKGVPMREMAINDVPREILIG